MDCDRWRSLWCAVFFAVHPAIVQAVAWIPGRNEELLAIEVLLCLICVIRYQQNSSWAFALAAVLVFLLALFTKETGFLILPAMVVVWLHKAAGRAKWQPLIWLTAGCLLGICIYGWVRAGAHLKDSGFPLMALLKVAAYRWPTLVQYLGKMVLPVNLSVFPLQRDTALLPGALVCLSLLALIFYVGKKRKESGVWAVITFLFLVPLLFIPPNMSIQAFEHRLYVPLLFFIPFTSSLFPVVPLQNRWTKPVPGILCGCFVLLQLNHQRYFNNATVFWAQAAKTAPSSAPAQMFCALYATDTNIARQHIARALELDSTTKYVHYNAGVIYFRLGRQQQARYHLQREIELHGYKGARALLQQINMQHLDTGKRIDTPTTPEQ
ncbi:MAG: hypothetical protein EBZ77_02185 [Chitinophagia bacterium]|nr:hypothetical protein [Chitinophagia bacterium]